MAQAALFDKRDRGEHLTFQIERRLYPLHGERIPVIWPGGEEPESARMHFLQEIYRVNEIFHPNKRILNDIHEPGIKFPSVLNAIPFRQEQPFRGFYADTIGWIACHALVYRLGKQFDETPIKFHVANYQETVRLQTFASLSYPCAGRLYGVDESLCVNYVELVRWRKLQ